MNHLTSICFLVSLTKVELPICKYYLIGQTIKKPFKVATRVENSLQLIHSNIYGLINIKVRHGASVGFFKTHKHNENYKFKFFSSLKNPTIYDHLGLKRLTENQIFILRFNQFSQTISHLNIQLLTIIHKNN